MEEQQIPLVRSDGGLQHYQRCNSLRCNCYQEGWKAGQRSLSTVSAEFYDWMMCDEVGCKSPEVHVLHTNLVQIKEVAMEQQESETLQKPIARDKNGWNIREGDLVCFPDVIEGVVYGIQRGMLLVAVPGYGTYGLWPQNAVRIDRLQQKNI